MKVVPLFFGDVETARRSVCDKVSAKRKQLGMTYDEIDGICRLGVAPSTINNSGDNIKPPKMLPKMEEFEQNSNVLSRRLLSRLMFPLRLKADELLAIDWTNPVHQEKLKSICQHMENTMSGPVAQAGSSPGATIDRETAAKVYVVLKALEEIDAEVAPKS